jgi:hypothetical protein
MKRLIAGVAAALLAMGIIASVASATHSNGEGPDKDFAVGTLKGPVATPFGNFPGQQHIDAMSGPQGGGGAQGHFYVSIFGTPFGDVHFSGDILCLTVVGNSDVNRALVTDSDTPLLPPGSGLLGRHIDNGEGADDPPDRALGIINPPSNVCPFIPLPTLPQVQGNITIHDGI